MQIKIRREKLRLRSPDEWRTALSAITNPVLRARVAGVVWWDYCEKSGWPDLRVFCPEYEKCRGVPVPQHHIREGLLAVGYTIRTAEIRCVIPKSGTVAYRAYRDRVKAGTVLRDDEDWGDDD